MCGIAGLISKHADPLESLLTGMLAQIVHRGPDESGVYFDDDAALGTVRLSIIDIATGQQPMTLGDRYVLSFNGAVYNFVELRDELKQLGDAFQTRSDTEVVLKSLVRWGTEALSKFDGHFAIAFYDRQEKELLLARDPFGEKPLFYTSSADRLAFASEMKAFRALPFFEFEMDSEALKQIAWTWTSLPQQSCFKNVHSVRPGHYLRCQNGSHEEHQYFSMPTLTQNSQISRDEAQEEVRRLMEQSVGRRLRSDLEVGSYLSGGLDSSIVSCLAHQVISDRLKTFSVSFESDVFDESLAQQEVASHLGTEHRTLRISHADIAKHFRDVVVQAETVLFRTAPVPMFLLSRFVQQAGIKVVLTGEGSDEFFCGYDLFKATLFRQQFNEFGSDQERAKHLVDLYPYLPHFNDTEALKLVNYFRSYADPSAPFFSHALRFTNGRLASQLLGRSDSFDPAPLNSEMNRFTAGNFDSLSKLAQAQATEVATLMSGYLLSSQGDRMTSANSLEGRCPFLNLDLIRFAQSLPLNFKLDEQGVEKKILRDAFSDRIPPQILGRRKQPYRAPDAAPFVSDSEYIDGLVVEGLLPDSTIIDQPFATRLIKKLQRTDSAKISPREDQAFVFLLSTLFLEKEYCQSGSLRTSLPTRQLNLTTRIDGCINHSYCDKRDRKSA